MSLANQCDARDRLSTGRSRSQHTFRPASQTKRTASSSVEQKNTTTEGLSFAEDFMLEHTGSGLRIALIGMTAGSKTAQRELQNSAQCYGFPS